MFLSRLWELIKYYYHYYSTPSIVFIPGWQVIKYMKVLQSRGEYEIVDYKKRELLKEQAPNVR